MKIKTANVIADHVLVFMFRPYNRKWVQPFACFASEEQHLDLYCLNLLQKQLLFFTPIGQSLKESLVMERNQTNLLMQCLELMDE
jgi:hypothetical protein